MSGRSRARRGARTQARRRRSARRVVLVVLALLVTGGVVYAGLQARDPEPTRTSAPKGSPTPSPSESLASVDLSDLPIERTAFCDRLDEGDVEDALGGTVSGTAHYDSGDRVPLATGLTDVSHEFDCTFDAADGTQARAWVFAEPVTAAIGRSIVREARAEKGCTVLDKAPAYGTPSVATLCRTAKPATQAVALRGLFGDAWLTCRLSAPGAPAEAEVTSRAEQWCVRVATTLGARP